MLYFINTVWGFSKMLSHELDKIDHKILQCLLEDGRSSFSQIAREVSLTDVAIKKRVERLKMRGIINAFSVDLNLKALGYQNPVFIQLRSELTKNRDVIKRLQQLDFILDLYQVLGEYNLLIRLVTPQSDNVQNYLKELEKIDGVLDIKTAMVLEHHKKANSLPSHSLQKKL